MGFPWAEWWFGCVQVRGFLSVQSRKAVEIVEKKIDFLIKEKVVLGATKFRQSALRGTISLEGT